MWYVYTMGYYSAIKRNGTVPFASTWMDLEIVILSEGSQMEKEKYYMASLICGIETSLVAQMVKHLSTVGETRVWSMGWEDPLEKAMATHSSILAWRIPWTEEPGGLQFMGRKESDTTERLHVHVHVHMWNVKRKDTSELTLKKNRDSQT